MSGYFFAFGVLIGAVVTIGLTIWLVVGLLKDFWNCF